MFDKSEIQKYVIIFVIQKEARQKRNHLVSKIYS